MVALFGFLATLIPAADPSEGNRLLAALTEKGVQVGEGEVVKLPQPSLADGLGAGEQKAVIEAIAGQHPLDRFMRDSVVSPFTLRLTPLKDKDDKRIAHRIDFWFVAHGPFEKAVNKDLFHDIFSSDPDRGEREKIRRQPLGKEELQQRGLSVSGSKGEEEFLHVEFPLLKRVQLSGVMHRVSTTTPSSGVICTLLDNRFAEDKTYPNRWRSISRAPGGEMKLGPFHPYSGMGGYTKVTKLSEPASALFVEFHATISEPYGWFDGANLLGSKLPLVVQNNIRDFRRSLKK